MSDGALAKIGCFFTGCCKGKATNKGWGVYREHDIARAYPAELYDCGAFLFSFLLIVCMQKMKVKEQTRMAISMFTYVLLRGWIENYYYNGKFFGDSVSRIIYACTIITCSIIFLKDQVTAKKQKNIKETRSEFNEK